MSSALPTQNLPSLRIPALDGTRGLAILMVTLYRFAREAFPREVYGHFIEKLIQIGSLGVDLFFVLSGFLITRILLQSQGTPHYFARFYFRRSLRIFPLYFLTLAVLLIAIPAFLPDQLAFSQASGKQSYLWTYTTNLKMSWDNAWNFGYLDHFWSLAVEEQFYLVWPFVIFLAPRRALGISVIGAATCAIARSTFCLLSDNTVAPDVFTLFRSDGLFLGAAVAAIWQNDPKLASIARFALRGLTGCVFMVAVTSMFGGRNLEISQIFTVGAWTCFLVTLLSPGKTAIGGMMESKTLRELGKYSYAMYVFKSPLIPLAERWFASAGFDNSIRLSPMYGAAYVIVMFIITFVAAIVSWNVFEVVILRLRDSAFTNRRDRV